MRIKNKFVYLFVLLLILTFTYINFAFILTENNFKIQEKTDNTDLLSLSAGVQIQFEWSRTWDSKPFDVPYSMAIDSFDNIHIVGCSKEIDNSDRDLFYLKFNKQGTKTKQIVRDFNNGNNSGNGIALDSSDNIYIAGFADSDSGPDQNFDGYIIKLSSSFVIEWEYTWGGEAPDAFYDIAIDVSDNIYVAGESNGSMCLVKYNANGIEQWNRIWGGKDKDWGLNVATDSANNIYLVGVTYSFGAGYSDICIVKYDSNGVQQWNRTWGDSGSEEPKDIIIDSKDNLYITGWYYDELTYATNVCLLKYNGLGNYIGFNKVETFLIDLTPYAIGIDWLDCVYIVYYYRAFGEYYIQLVKFDQNMAHCWTLDWDGASEEIATALVLDSTDDVYFTGVKGEGTNYDLFLVKYKNLIPDIIIHEPRGIVCNGGPLEISYEINCDPNWIAYSLDGGLNITILGNTTIPLPSDGPHYIQLFAYDSLGNIRTSEIVNFIVDTKVPEIEINEPIHNKMFGITPPTYNISVVEANIDSIWYNIEGGANWGISQYTGSINSNVWRDAPEGLINLTFYVKDIVGNVSSAGVQIRKDSIPPVININTPSFNSLYSDTAPSYNVKIFDINLNHMWYTINGENNSISFNANGTLNQGLWDKFSSGNLTVRFYANDSMGNEAFEEVKIQKDIDPPQIVINYPEENQEFVDSIPFFSLHIIESHLDTVWYTINDLPTKYMFNRVGGYIKPEIWNATNDGAIIFKFYANDTIGHQSFQQISIIKKTSKPKNAFPGYNPILIFLVIIFTSIVLKKRKFKLKKLS